MDNKDDNISPLEKLIQWLEEKHSQIMGFEQSALDLLKNGDVAGYKAKMREKAEMLRDLHRQSMPLLLKIDGDTRFEIERRIESFSASAATALSLNSPFYMSALLYPDEHKAGEPDNLELFISEIKAEDTK